MGQHAIHRPASVWSSTVIPLRDDIPTRRRPVATIVLIAINVAVFFLVQSPLRGTDVVQIDGGTVRIDSEIRFDLEFAAIPCELTQGRPLTINEARRDVRRRRPLRVRQARSQPAPCSPARTCTSR